MSESQVDLKAMIVAKLKAKGMDIAEDTAVALVKAVLELIPEVVAATPNKVDDLLIAIIPVVQPALMDLLDKIDGEEG
jgi:predicted histidine transporter YuiF (NhaC family)